MKTEYQLLVYSPEIWKNLPPSQRKLPIQIVDGKEYLGLFWATAEEVAAFIFKG